MGIVSYAGGLGVPRGGRGTGAGWAVRRAPADLSRGAGPPVRGGCGLVTGSPNRRVPALDRPGVAEAGTGRSGV